MIVNCSGFPLQAFQRNSLFLGRPSCLDLLKKPHVCFASAVAEVPPLVVDFTDARTIQNVHNPHPRFAMPLDPSHFDVPRPSDSGSVLQESPVPLLQPNSTEIDFRHLDDLTTSLEGMLQSLKQDRQKFVERPTVQTSRWSEERSFHAFLQGPSLVKTAAGKTATNRRMRKTQSQRLAMGTMSSVAAPRRKVVVADAETVISNLQMDNSRQLLKKDEEVSLTQAVKELMRLEACKKLLAKQIHRRPTLEELGRYTRTDPRSLPQLLLLGKEAKLLLVQHNAGLVRAIANKYANKGLPMQDLVEEGVQGLLHAITKFEPSKGFRLSTYATWWIRSRVQEAVRLQTSVISVPYLLYDDLMKLQRAWSLMKVQMGREPYDVEVARNLGWDTDRVVKARNCAMFSKTRIWSMETSGRGENQEEAPLEVQNQGLESDGEAGSRSSSQDAEQLISQHLFDRDVAEILKSVNPKAEQVLRMRNGFGVNKPMSLKLVGQELGLSGEAIRHIQKVSMSRLRKDWQVKANIAENLMYVPDTPDRGTGGAGKKQH